jgi:hypothetical protein
MQGNGEGGAGERRCAVASDRESSHDMEDDLSSQGGSKATPTGVHIPWHGHGYLRPGRPGEVRNPSELSSIFEAK